MQRLVNAMARLVVVSWPDWIKAGNPPIERSGSSSTQCFQFSSRSCARAGAASARQASIAKIQTDRCIPPPPLFLFASCFVRVARRRLFVFLHRRRVDSFAIQAALQQAILELRGGGQAFHHIEADDTQQQRRGQPGEAGGEAPLVLAAFPFALGARAL